MNHRVTRPTDASGSDAAEAELIRRFLDGDRDAFRGLLRPHLAALAALARRAAADPHAADDLVQETLVRACQALATFRGDGSFRSWLFRILVRLAAQPGRWRGRERAGPLELDVPAALGQEPDELALGRELRDRLAEAMERLPTRQRTALHLRAAEGFGYERIGSVLECSAGAARMLVLEARRKVLERLGGYLEP